MAIIQIGRQEFESWPPDDQQTKQRLQNYKRSRLLFKGKHHDVFPRIQRWLERQEDQELIYIVANFAGLLSKVSADMLFGEVPGFYCKDAAEDSPEQKALTDLAADNKLATLNYEMALSSSWRGETIYKARFGKFSDWAEKDHAIIEAASPGIFWPILDGDNVHGLMGGVFGWVKEANDNKIYLRIERQLPGRIENELYLLDGQSIGEQVKLSRLPEYANLEEYQDTGYPGLLFEVVPNWRLDDEFWGINDYYDLEGIFDELNNRVSRISRVLDKHESPKLILPPGIMKEDRNNPGRWYVDKEDLEAIEVDPEGENVGDLPKYLTWDAQLDAGFKQVDKLLELAFLLSETSADAFGLGRDGGRAESGRALKFRLIRLLAKINRKKLYFDEGLRNIMYAAQYLGHVHGNGPEPQEVRIDWKDGLPADSKEAAEVEAIRTGSKATASVRSAVRRLDGMVGHELEDELAEIQEDQGAGGGITEPGIRLPNLNVNLDSPEGGENDPVGGE